MNDYINQTATQLPPMSVWTKIKLAIIAGVMLSIGFITSVFLLMVSAIMLPFAAVKLWLLKKQFDETIHSQHNTQTNNTDAKTSHGQVFEGEYVSE